MSDVFAELFLLRKVDEKTGSPPRCQGEIRRAGITATPSHFPVVESIARWVNNYDEWQG